MPRLHLGMLKSLAGDWQRLQPWLVNEDQINLLRELETELAPRLQTKIEPTTSARLLQRFLPTVDLTAVNKARDGYNRYYLLEKECAMRSPR